ncbi:3616_t:CDS:2 [Dentiscutata heterogama]|uniref:3616_t:CDS:1 n=1 Tax=Dentiscutata heterogama TaxID=1316150 RepID=A0ACA9K4Q7_9GLOM|nr:3616_t:CDS:2 [Dentiscutata heterogama]
MNLLINRNENASRIRAENASGIKIEEHKAMLVELVLKNKHKV